MSIIPHRSVLAGALLLGLAVAAVAAIPILFPQSVSGFADGNNDCVHDRVITSDVVLTENFFKGVQNGDFDHCISERSQGRWGNYYAQFYNLTLPDGVGITAYTSAADLDTYFYLREGHNAVSGGSLAKNDDCTAGDCKGVYRYNSQMGIAGPGEYTLEVTTYRHWAVAGNAYGFAGQRYQLGFEGFADVVVEEKPIEGPRSLSNGGCAYNLPRDQRTEQNKPANWDRDNPNCAWVVAPEAIAPAPAICAGYWDGDAGSRWRNTANAVPVNCYVPALEIPEILALGGEYNSDTAGVLAEIDAASNRYANDGHSMTDQAPRMLQIIRDYITDGSGSHARYTCRRYARWGAYLQEWDVQQDRYGWASLIGLDNDDVRRVMPYGNVVPDDENWYNWCKAIPR